MLWMASSISSCNRATDVPDRLLRVEEAAERLAYSTTVVYRLIRAGRLRAVRLGPGSPWRVPDDAIGEFIDSLDDNSPGWWHRDR